jgi:16S rRNA processing protein RimM
VAARAQERQRICVARLGAPHGVRGDVKLWSFTADPAAVADYGPFETADGRVIEIETMRPAKDFFVVRLKGVADRDAVEQLRNAELFVPRDRLPAPDGSDEFYHADLIGLAVVDAAGATLGSVVAVHNFGAGDLIEVRFAALSDTVMLPFTQATVPAIDIAGGRIVIAPPDGTFAPAGVDDEER